MRYTLHATLSICWRTLMLRIIWLLRYWVTLLRLCASATIGLVVMPVCSCSRDGVRSSSRLAHAVICRRRRSRLCHFYCWDSLVCPRPLTPLILISVHGLHWYLFCLCTNVYINQPTNQPINQSIILDLEWMPIIRSTLLPWSMVTTTTRC